MHTQRLERTQKNRLTQVVEALSTQPSLNGLSDAQLNAIAKSVVLDNFKDQLKNEVTKFKISDSIEKLKLRWLNKFQSVHTRRSFKTNIEVFLKWLGSVSIADVDAQIADDYVAFLRTVTSQSKREQKISDNTILQRIAACSSFYKNLVRWRFVATNPFNGCARPKKLIEIKNSDQVPTNQDLDKLEQLATELMHRRIQNHKTNTKRMNNAGKKAFLAIQILRSTGLRVGALPTLSIDSRGFYTAKSKGGVAAGKLNKNVLAVIETFGLHKKQPFENFSSGAFSMWLQRKTQGRFTVHSIRHLFAIHHYEKHRDIFALSKALGHKNAVPTQAYLASLQI